MRVRAVSTRQPVSMLARYTADRPIGCRTEGSAGAEVQAKELSGVKIKGSGLATTLRVVKNRYGDRVHDRVRSALPEETRALLDQTLVSEWYPIEHVGHVMAAIKACLGDQEPDVIHAVSTGAAKAAFNLVYRAFFKFGYPSYLIKRTAAV
jgi:hypothetical protein